MKRYVVELVTQVGKPLQIQRYEYHLSEDDNHEEVITYIKMEHGPGVQIGCGRARVLEVVYIKEITSPAPTQQQQVEIYHREEDDYEDIKVKGKRKRRI